MDRYTQRQVNEQLNSRWKGFTEGGTLRALVTDLANYIRTGEPIRNHFGQWPEGYRDGDLWAIERRRWIKYARPLLERLRMQRKEEQ